MDEFIRENITFLLTLGSSLVAVVIGGLGIQRYFHSQKIERLQELHTIEKDKLRAEIDKTQIANTEKIDPKELIQEAKIVYVKYLHIRRDSEPPIYQKYIERLEETIDVHSEYHFYRFNKYNHQNNAIKLTDRSTGIVDQNILYPWQELVFTDVVTQKHKGRITQNVNSCDSYFSATTYYNGFKENNEDIGTKMEMDTEEARMIADFSSIVGLDKLFLKEPDAYKIDLNGKKIELPGLEKLSPGVYHIASFKLKKGESLLLDFHVNWDYLND